MDATGLGFQAGMKAGLPGDEQVHVLPDGMFQKAASTATGDCNGRDDRVIRAGRVQAVDLQKGFQARDYLGEGKRSSKPAAAAGAQLPVVAGKRREERLDFAEPESLRQLLIDPLRGGVEGGMRAMDGDPSSDQLE